MSTIKVDTIATRTGSGNITVSNNIAGGGTISGTNLTASGTLGVTGTSTLSSTLNMSSSHIQFSGNISLPNVGAALFRPAADTIAFGINNGQRVSVNQHGLLFGTDTAAANALNDYEEGTWTVGVSKNAAITSPTDQHGYYIRVGDLAFLSFYWYKNSGVTTSGTNQWMITGIPFELRASANSGYQHGHVGYINVGGDRTGDGNHRWQVNNGLQFVLYGPYLNHNVSNQAVEFSGSITCRIA